MLSAMILMIDLCNSNEGLSAITATAVFIGVFSSDSYSELNKE
jgi:hypothetical protein